MSTAVSAIPSSASSAFGRAREFVVARRALVAAFVFLLFLWPFELPIAMSMHGFAFETLKEWYGILFHGSALCVVSAAVIASGRWKERHLTGDLRSFASSSLLYVMVGVVALPITSSAPVEIRFTYQQLVCGYLAPALAMAALLTLSPTSQAKAWTWFYAGWCAFLGASFILLAASWKAADVASPALAEMGFAERLLLWRYTLGEEWNIYGVFVGNSNKMSNYLVIFFLLSTWLVGIDGKALSSLQRLVLRVFLLFSTITLVLLFSRAALLLMPVVVVASGMWSHIPRKPAAVLLLALVGGLLAVVIVEPRIFQYLFTAQLFDDSEANPLGTFVDRFEQWSTLLRFLTQHYFEAIFGLGTTGYGILFFHNSEPGTHNFFLDLWVESGIFGITVFALFLLNLVYQVAASKQALRARAVIGLALAILVMLMTREHSVSYLYVTSLGGLCVMVISYLSMAGKSHSVEGGQNK